MPGLVYRDQLVPRDAYRRHDGAAMEALPERTACKFVVGALGRVEIDSNSVENLIRPIALNRKNALFAGHDEGGKAWGRIASLIETAKINRVEPFAYLKATLEAIAGGHPLATIDDLLPWNFQPST